MMLKLNQRVRVTTEAGTVIGRVEQVRPITEMSGVMLYEMGVEQVASISYHASPNCQLMFTALEIAGEWYDLRREKLELEIVGAIG